ncbi:MAG: DDE-type integrase/transposase/recombinase [Betaproteobacteria bacterium]|nr:MAG: DDE-type integrase/transposase/recombinase [Betaproteobacteria bacterium]
MRSRSSRPCDRWYLDEVFLRINARPQYLSRAVDQDGEVLDILVLHCATLPALRTTTWAFTR